MLQSVRGVISKTNANSHFQFELNLHDALTCDHYFCLQILFYTRDPSAAKISCASKLHKPHQNLPAEDHITVNNQIYLSQ